MAGDQEKKIQLRAPSQGEDSRFIRFCKRLEFNRLKAAGLAIGCLVALSRVFLWPWWVTALLAVALFIVQICDLAKDETKLETLQAELSATQSRETALNEDLARLIVNLEEIFKCLLGGAVGNDSILLSDYDWSETDRINIFRPEAGIYQCVGRHSVHPDYREKGVLFTGLDEGYLAKAWKSPEGTFLVNDLPDYSAAKAEYETAFVSRCGLKPKNCSKLRMKPRSILVFCIYDLRGKQRLALCVLESLSPGKFNDPCLPDNLRQTPILKTVRDLLETGYN